MRGVQHRLDCSGPELEQEWFVRVDQRSWTYERCPECGRAAWINAVFITSGKDET